MLAGMSDTISALVSPVRGRGQPALYVGLTGDAAATSPMRISLHDVQRVDICRADAPSVQRGRDRGANVVTLELPDARMSSKHARLTRLGAGWVLEDLQSKNGTWLHRTRIAREQLADGDGFVVGHTALVFRERGGDVADALDARAMPAPIAAGLATLSPDLAARFTELARAAVSPAPIELSGESGTGKELVARAVHELSGRTGAFVAINCGAIAPTLVEAELFGHRRGAFTGAGEQRQGLVRTADRGTLFLDEIAELPEAAQAALLRVLQEGDLLPIGSDAPVRVDLRVVTATHKNLDAEVSAGRFRPDLRARLLGVQVTLPPLRERREDLALLLPSLLARHAPERPFLLYPDALAALYDHAWPLNVRELERALVAALAIAGDHVELGHLPGNVRGDAPAQPPAAEIQSLSAADRDLYDQLVDAMRRHDGNITAIGRELGKDRTQIRRWLKRFGLARESD